MTTLSTWTTRNKVGFVLAIIVAVPGLVPTPTPDGEDGPPAAIIILNIVLSLIALVAVIVAWRTGRSVGVRIAIGALAICALSALPAFFVDVPAWIKIAVAVAIVLTVASAVLMLSPAEKRAAVASGA